MARPKYIIVKNWMSSGENVKGKLLVADTLARYQLENGAVVSLPALQKSGHAYTLHTKAPK